MTKILIVLLLTASAVVFSETGPYPGQIAPNFQLKELNGSKINFESIYNKGPVWLTLFATWCKECATEMPLLVQSAKNNPDISFVGIDIEEEKNLVKDFQKKYSIEFPIALDIDGEIIDPYRVGQIPVNIGIAQGGKVLFRRQALTQYAQIESLINFLRSNGKMPLKAKLNYLLNPATLILSFFAALVIFFIYRAVSAHSKPT